MFEPLNANRCIMMELINVYEQGVIIGYDEWQTLDESMQDDYVTSDDFADCDYIKIKNEIAVNFIQHDGKIFYILMPEFEEHEEYIQFILLRFFADDFKTTFNEVDTWLITGYDKSKYKAIQQNGIVLYYRGGVGYVYGVHELKRLDLKDAIEFLNNHCGYIDVENDDDYSDAEIVDIANKKLFGDFGIFESQ